MEASRPILKSGWSLDDWGNAYWQDDRKAGPAIFPHKKLVEHDGAANTAEFTGVFTALRSTSRGFICDALGYRIRFPSANAAAQALGLPSVE